MTEKEKMLSGKLYIASGEELKEDYLRAKRIIRLYNSSTEYDVEYRKQLIKELFEATGENFKIQDPFYCDYGSNISIGENFYANYDCIFLDVNKIKIGNNVQFGPRVSLYTAGHPIDKDIRNEQLEFGKPIIIGNDVWVGGNVVINPGVTIGSNVVIGSGSVVTKDIPDNVVAVGNPCKVLRKINENDKLIWEKQKREYYSNK